MRDRRLIFISMMAIFLVMGISLGSVSALDFGDYDDTWYKVKVKLKGFCAELPIPTKLSRERASDKAWIYIESLTDDPGIASLVTQNDDETWQATDVELSFLIGTADHAVYESNEITIVDSNGDQFAKKWSQIFEFDKLGIICK